MSMDHTGDGKGQQSIYQKKPEDCRYSFFQHLECEFFPCHKTEYPSEFNCLFCYCPLYALGEDCGGNYRYNPSGTKDCSQCMAPHTRESCRMIGERFPAIKALAAQKKID